MKTKVRVSEGEKEMLDAPITMEEMINALNSMPTNKTPASIGLTAEFYRKFWPLIGQIVYQATSYA